MIFAFAKTAAAKRKLLAMASEFTPEKIDHVVDRAAFETQGVLIRKTPKKWFGQVRRSWTTIKPKLGVRVVTNPNPIMLYLEEGTRAHGPKDVQGPDLKFGRSIRKRALFIPLTRRAVNATAGTFGVGSVDSFKQDGEEFWEQRAAIFKPQVTIRNGRQRVKGIALVFGVDYVLAKRVRGITARHIVRNERPKARLRLFNGMKRYVRSVIAK